MRLISTTALAKLNDIETKEMFEILVDNGWMYKKEDQWHLTKEGRMAGGEMKYNPKYGEYIVWPEDLDIEQNLDYKETLSATKIGKHFNISSQKVNLYLSELGWIEKGMGGWVCTKAGIKNGAIQMEAYQNGKPYVVWNDSILNNKHLVREVNMAKGDEDILEFEKDIEETDDFRKKFPAKIRTPDGHYVRSRAEVMIDDFLYKNGIVHAYEKKLNIDESMYCDFYIPAQKLYIEFWGLEENEQYKERKQTKLELYAKYKFKLIELNNSDIENLDERFAAKLRKFDIVVD
jgi:hypothetical protein